MVTSTSVPWSLAVGTQLSCHDKAHVEKTRPATKPQLIFQPHPVSTGRPCEWGDLGNEFHDAVEINHSCRALSKSQIVGKINESYCFKPQSFWWINNQISINFYEGNILATMRANIVHIWPLTFSEVLTKIALIKQYIHTYI